MKKSISIILTFCMVLSVAVVSGVCTFAAEPNDTEPGRGDIEDTTPSKNDNLYNAKQRLEYLLEACGNTLELTPGPAPIYQNTTALYHKYYEAQALAESETATDEDRANMINELLDMVNGLKFDADYIADCYEVAAKEQNYNNYYSDEGWTSFQTALAKLKAALDSGADADSEFRDMLQAYNKMCKENQTMYDIDGDGTVNISDATLLQKYIARLADLTGAQKMLVGEDAYLNGISIRNVTEIQKCLAELTDTPESTGVFYNASDYSYITDETLDRNILNMNVCKNYYEQDRDEAGIVKMPIYPYDSFIFILTDYYDLCAKNNIAP